MTIRSGSVFAAVLFAFVLLPTAASSQTAGTPLDVETIVGAKAVRAEGSGNIRWTEDGSAYMSLEDSTGIEGGSDIVRHDLPGETRRVIVAASDLIPQGEQAPLNIGDYALSPDGRKLLVFTNTRQFRRTKAFGDYWLLDLDRKTLRKLGGDAPPSSLMYADFSPDGTRIAYVRGNNLYVEPTSGEAPPRALTGDGDELIVNGLGDWVYEEEFGLAKAFAWSPDSRRIAYWRFDTSGVGTFYMVKNTGGQYSQPIPLQYPKAGTTNSAVRVGSVEIESGRTTWFDLEGEPRQNYVPQMSWAGGSDAVFIQYANRLQNRFEVRLGDPVTGATSMRFVEQDEAWVELNDAPTWLRDGDAFTWLSEREGWRHLYVVPKQGGQPELRTPGEFDVMSVLAIDEAGGWAYFIASPDNPTQRYLYRATLAGEPRVERVTPDGQAGWHGYDISPGARWAIHRFSTAETPPVASLVDLSDQTVVRELTRNQPLRDLLAANPAPETEFLRLHIGDGVTLDAWLMKPAGFDPSKSYPILFYVYGEPFGLTVTDQWGGERALWHRMLAQQGYLVASIDPRGTPQPRGRAWRKSIYRQVGILASADLAAGVREMLSERPYIDPDRVGVWGWSGGGAMTMNAMFRYPDLYKTGIAVAGPADQLLYDSIYQERYMGLPDDNPAGYRDGSPIHFAENLEGDLLLIHGTLDDNVHYQNLEQLAARLIAANKPFDMMAYPDSAHGISTGENTKVHLFSMMTRYLDENLMQRDVDIETR
jgi:dipeptidyl-peptidase-4